MSFTALLMATGCIIAFPWSHAFSDEPSDVRASIMSRAECRPQASTPDSDESSQDCGQIGSYRVAIASADDREFLSLKKGERKLDLPFHQFVGYPKTRTNAFCSIGNRIEWRLRQLGGKWEPFAVVIHMRWRKNEKSLQDTVMVGHVSDEGACVVATYDGVKTKDVDAKARAFADRFDLIKARCIAPVADGD